MLEYVIPSSPHTLSGIVSDCIHHNNELLQVSVYIDKELGHALPFNSKSSVLLHTRFELLCILKCS